MHDEDDIAHIGKRHVWGGEQPFGLLPADRRQHLYSIGKSGTGKTTLLRSMILADIEAGRGVGVLDPHGDLAEDLLQHIPPWRTDHVVYFNPADQDYPMALNLLQRVPAEARHLVASSVVSAFKSVWGRDAWGPRLEYVLFNCVAALLECENTSLLGVQRMLTDGRYREWVTKQVRDRAVRTFWLNEFASWDKRFAAEAASPIQNKIGQLVAGPLFNVLGQVRSRFDPRFTMDRRRIFIANLSKGLIGEDRAKLLGAILVSQFQTAAMARAGVPEDERVDFYLYVDEFHNFASESFNSILAELRKYRLNLAICHQHLAQTRPDTVAAVFGNVGSIVAFRVGESDAAVLSREFGGGFDPSLFSNLGNGEICVKLLQNGCHTDPFLGKTLPPSGKWYGRSYNLIRRSRERYATPRRVVEDKLKRWMQEPRQWQT